MQPTRRNLDGTLGPLRVNSETHYRWTARALRVTWRATLGGLQRPDWVTREKEFLLPCRAILDGMDGHFTWLEPSTLDCPGSCRVDQEGHYDWPSMAFLGGARWLSFAVREGHVVWPGSATLGCRIFFMVAKSFPRKKFSTKTFWAKLEKLFSH